MPYFLFVNNILPLTTFDILLVNVIGKFYVVLVSILIYFY